MRGKEGKRKGGREGGMESEKRERGKRGHCCYCRVISTDNL